MAVDVQELLLKGIDAYAETQQVRYQANNPTPQVRGQNDESGAAGEPLRETVADTLSMPTNQLLLIAAAVLLFILVKD